MGFAGVYAVVNLHSIGATRIKIQVQQFIHALVGFIEIWCMRSIAESTKVAYEIIMPEGESSTEHFLYSEVHHNLLVYTF